MLVNRSFQFLFFLAITLVFGCNGSKMTVQSNSQPISHQLWEEVLQAHVSEDGKVDYAGLKKDPTKLNAYLKLMGDNHPNAKNWSENERLAYWINAYNAYTIELILKHYPVKSIKDIKKGIVLLNTVWDIKFIEIEGNTYDLNHIEHGILRKEFEEPRIHFAIVCASYSCPNLLNHAFTAEQMEEQLTTQSKAFINDPSKNKLAPNQIQLSKIFSWFKGDFTKKGTLIEFLNTYSTTKINSEAASSFLDYSWSLNE